VEAVRLGKVKRKGRKVRCYKLRGLYFCMQRRQRAWSARVRRIISSEAVRSINWSVGSTVRESLVAGRASGGTKHAVLVLAPAPSRLRACSSTPLFSAPASVLPAEAGEGVWELRARARIAGLPLTESPETPTLTKFRPIVASGSERKAARHAAACCFAIALELGEGVYDRGRLWAEAPCVLPAAGCGCFNFFKS
jgi:hypothetical protein